MSRRIIYLGLDYGTSASKLIFRDENASGGPRIFPVLYENQFRIPSTVGWNGATLRFGAERPTWPEPGTRWLDRLKMRMAEEAIPPSGPDHPTLPGGFSATDLVTLTLWWLLSRAEDTILRYLRRSPGDRASLALSPLLGVPMKFYDDPRIKQRFADAISRAALLRNQRARWEGNTCSLDEAGKALEWARNACADGCGDGGWVRSESQAGLWWATHSPLVAEGRFAEVDIGAGTTHASFFTLGSSEAGKKQGLYVYSSTSVSTGMDDVDQALARAREPPPPWITLRGQEDRFLGHSSLREACARPFAEMRAAFVNAWGLAFKKNKGFDPERLALLGSSTDFQLMVCGGGSLVSAVSDVFARHPHRRDRRLQPIPPDAPSELKASGLDPRMLPFAFVAYGLSDPNLLDQVVMTPREVPDSTEKKDLPAPNLRPCPACGGQGCPKCGNGWLSPREERLEMPPFRTLPASPPRTTRESAALRPPEHRRPPPLKASRPGKGAASPPSKKRTVPHLPAKAIQAPSRRIEVSVRAKSMKQARPLTPRERDWVAHVANRLRAASLVVVDETSHGGYLWVEGGPDLAKHLAEIVTRKVSFSFKPTGARATESRPAWFWRPK